MSHHHKHNHLHDHCDSHEHQHRCCCCEQCECEHNHHHEHEEGGFAKELLELADDAWMEVLYEKIKAHIAKVHGKQLDNLAQIVSESNSERWKFKMGKQKTVDDFHNKLEDHFYHKK